MEAILVPEDVQGGSLNDEQSGQSLRSAMRRTLGSIVGISDRGLFPVVESDANALAGVISQRYVPLHISHR